MTGTVCKDCNFPIRGTAVKGLCPLCYSYQKTYGRTRSSSFLPTTKAFHLLACIDDYKNDREYVEGILFELREMMKGYKDDKDLIRHCQAAIGPLAVLREVLYDRIEYLEGN